MNDGVGRRVAVACFVVAGSAAAVLARPTSGPTSGPATAAATTSPATTTAAATTAPAATAPAATEPATRPLAVVEPAALQLLDKLAACYAAGRPLHVVGTLIGTFDVAGRRQTFTLDVDGRTDGAGRFVHVARGAGLLVSDGVDAYLFDAKRNAYATLPAAPARAAAGDVDASVVGVLLDEDPALLLTLTDDPAGLLRRAATAIRLPRGPASGPATEPAASSAELPGVAVLELVRGGKRQTLRIDSGTGRLLGSTIDFTPLLAARKTNGVKAARVVLTYAASTDEPPPSGAFAWHPPVSATQFDVGENLLRAGAATAPATRPAIRRTR